MSKNKLITIAFDIETNNSLDTDTAQVIQLVMNVYEELENGKEELVESIVKYYQPTHFNTIESKINDLEEYINDNEFPGSEHAIEDFKNYILKYKPSYIYGHNVLAFDLPILKYDLYYPVMDTLLKARKLSKIAKNWNTNSFKLGEFCINNNLITEEGSIHNAVRDVEITKILHDFLKNTTNKLADDENISKTKATYIYPKTVYFLQNIDEDKHSFYSIPTNMLTSNEYLNNVISYCVNKGIILSSVRKIMGKLQSHSQYRYLKEILEREEVLNMMNGA